jgi:hypothetical protein
MYYEKLQVSPRTSSTKCRVYYARDEDWNPVVVKGPLLEKEILAMLETERIKRLLGVPRTCTRRDGMFLVSDCLYDYTFSDYHICTTGIDRGERLSNIKLRMWKHEYRGQTIERSFLKALALRLILGTDDTVPRNFVVVDDTVYSIDDPAWKIEPSNIWKVRTHKQHYSDMLDTHWTWVQSFLDAWKKHDIGEFSVRMCDKYLNRDNWVF